MLWFMLRNVDFFLNESPWCKTLGTVIQSMCMLVYFAHTCNLLSKTSPIIGTLASQHTQCTCSHLQAVTYDHVHMTLMQAQHIAHCTKRVRKLS